MRRTLIAGVGNELLSDEGFGVHVARALKARPLPPGVDILEAGTAFLDAVPETFGYNRLILVDAIAAGGAPGTLHHLELDDDMRDWVAQTASLSLHQTDLLETLAIARLMGPLPERIMILGAEPERIEMGLDLSPALQRAVERIVPILIAESVTPEPQLSGTDNTPRTRLPTTP
jgi:hydrogenase maturation protease